MTRTLLLYVALGLVALVARRRAEEEEYMPEEWLARYRRSDGQ